MTQNLTAPALFCDIVMDVVCARLFDLAPKTGRAIAGSSGHFGPVAARASQIEENKRQAHRGHGMCISAVFPLPLLRSLLRRLGESIVRWMASLTTARMEKVEVDGSCSAGLYPAAHPAGQAPFDRHAKHALSIRKFAMPDPADMPIDSQAYRDHVARCQAKHVNHGRHTSRCRQSGHHGSDDDYGEGFSLPYSESCHTDPTCDRKRQVNLMPRNRGKIVMHSRAVVLAFKCNHNVFFSGVQNFRVPRHMKSNPSPACRRPRPRLSTCSPRPLRARTMTRPPTPRQRKTTTYPRQTLRRSSRQSEEKCGISRATTNSTEVSNNATYMHYYTAQFSYSFHSDYYLFKTP
jgi:hypothetical protein